MTDPLTRPASLTDRYVLDDDPTRIDHDVVVAYLANEAYWGRWRSPEVVIEQIASAWRVVGAYQRDTGTMVGFARALSDGVALAYLADVFVQQAHRGQGLGRALIAHMIDEGPGADFRWMLHTADAHRLYADFGFAAPDPSFMERPAGPAKRGLLPPSGTSPT